MLENVGMDQTTWPNFVDTFEKASEASHWLEVINLAGFSTFAMPPLTSMLVSIALQISIEMATNLRSLQRFGYGNNSRLRT